jgi:hypothetical protein
MGVRRPRGFAQNALQASIQHRAFMVPDEHVAMAMIFSYGSLWVNSFSFCRAGCGPLPTRAVLYIADLKQPTQ